MNDNGKRQVKDVRAAAKSIGRDHDGPSLSQSYENLTGLSIYDFTAVSQQSSSAASAAGVPSKDVGTAAAVAVGTLAASAYLQEIER